MVRQFAFLPPTPPFYSIKAGQSPSGGPGWDPNDPDRFHTAGAESSQEVTPLVAWCAMNADGPEKVVQGPQGLSNLCFRLPYVLRVRV